MRPRSLLRTGQLATIAELKASTGVQAVLGMGAGKTACGLTAIRDLIDEGVIRSAIVVAPRRVALEVWPVEPAKWEHLRKLKVVVLKGGPIKRATRLAEPADVYVCGVDNLQWLLDALCTLPEDDPRWDLLVIDELSKFKSPRGKRARALLANASRFRALWGLSGTPQPNDIADQWMQLQLVSAGEAFDKSFDEWRRAYFRSEDYNGYSWTVHEFAKPVIKRVVDEWTFTVPPTAESEVPFIAGDDYDIMVDPTEHMAADLHDMNKRLLVELGAEGLDVSKLVSGDFAALDETLVVALTKAVACGKMTQIMQGHLYNEGAPVQWYDPNPKLAALVDTLRGLRGDPCLVAYHHQADLELLRAAYGRLYKGKLPYLGQGVSDAAGSRLIEQWNGGELDMMALHPASAGHGLNLQEGGRRIIWFQPTWSAELYAQTVKRLARPGQTRPVYSHRVRMRHWLEDLRVHRVEHKLKEQDDFIRSLPCLTS